MTTAELSQRDAERRLIRAIRAGHRVRGIAAGLERHVGVMGVVEDPDPFYGDGVRRIRVRFDGEATAISVLPRSIEIVR